MDASFQADLEKIYKKLKVGLNYDEIVNIVNIVKPTTYDTNTKHSDSLAKIMKFKIETTIKKTLYNKINEINEIIEKAKKGIELNKAIASKYSTSIETKNNDIKS